MYSVFNEHRPWGAKVRSEDDFVFLWSFVFMLEPLSPFFTNVFIAKISSRGILYYYPVLMFSAD
ncbi:MAG TPA: hypothetical protein DET40_19705 [Lentisphaeria bacterium]|nr:MAG: hypothetical protein A2X45_11180 [Lentisphaerae bacterium GWF2_50_93]HCE45775.1 hypothetical protein [Lentisphaeria bacterium]